MRDRGAGDGNGDVRNPHLFKDVHKTKAVIHTWLAWQDEPGPQLHEAVKHRVLDPKKPESRAFVDWFRRLFGVYLPKEGPRRCRAFSDLRASGSAAVIDLTGHGGGTIRIENIDVDELDAEDFAFRVSGTEPQVDEI